MEKQTGISLLVKIESSYLNCRSSAVRPHLGARIDASFTKSYEYLQFKLPVTVSHQLFADLHDKICANLIQGFHSDKRWLGEKLIEEARKETQSASIPASRFYGVWKDGDFPEVHYLVVGLAGSATSVQFIEEEVPVKGYVDVFAETVYESPAFAEAGAAFEVHVRGCRQFEYALEYGCHPPVLFD